MKRIVVELALNSAVLWGSIYLFNNTSMPFIGIGLLLLYVGVRVFTNFKLF